MVVLGADVPMWAAILQQRGPEITVAVMAETGMRDLVLTADPTAARVEAVGRSRRPDRYTTAWTVTEALTELFTGFADETVSLRVVVESLQVDVPGDYFAAGVLTRRRWSVLSTSRLVHSSVHDDPSTGLFRDTGAHHPRA